jgi:hypothetical protein
MTTTPLIVRVALAADWNEAFRIVRSASFATAAADHGLDAAGVSLAMGDLPPWPQRRRLCRSLARRCAEEYGDEGLAGAWTMLGADPRGPEWRTRAGGRTYAFIFRALADAIVADPALVDDAAFAAAVEGWHVLQHAGSDGEDDLIVVARRYGVMAKIDGDEVLAWARRSTSRDDDARHQDAAPQGPATAAPAAASSARDHSQGHHEGRGGAAARPA